MSAPPPAASESPPVAGRDRLRLLALLALVVIWHVPTWVEAQVGDQAVEETGAVRSGAAAALALVVLWGLAAASLAARTIRGFRLGAALTDMAVALLTALLLLDGHPWIPGGDLRAVWVPVFAPLAMLALLDGLVARFGRRPGRELAVIRAGAALFACVSLILAGQWIPAGIALWLVASPLMFLRIDTPTGARRSLEGFFLVAAIVAGLSPWIHKVGVGWNPALRSDLTLPVYLWCVTAAFLVTTALDGLMRPEAEPTGV